MQGLRPILWALLLSLSGLSWAKSPPNLQRDIPWQDTGVGANGQGDNRFAGVEDIRVAFNRARRQEEQQLGLHAGQLGQVRLPAQDTWDSMADDARALWLINQARVARSDMQPGVLGLPLQGVAQQISQVAEYYAQYLVQHNAMGHSADGRDPWRRLAEAVPVHCLEFLSRAENLFFTTHYSTSAEIEPQPLPVERAVYAWLYEDASAHWGHRETVLLQNTPLGGGGSRAGYKNNSGDSASEGLLGFSRVESREYDPFNASQWPYRWGTAVAMNIVDPSPSDCDLTLLYTHDTQALQPIEP